MDAVRALIVFVALSALGAGLRDARAGEAARAEADAGGHFARRAGASMRDDAGAPGLRCSGEREAGEGRARTGWTARPVGDGPRESPG